MDLPCGNASMQMISARNVIVVILIFFISFKQLWFNRSITLGLSYLVSVQFIIKQYIINFMDNSC